jgi:Replication-relaxation
MLGNKNVILQPRDLHLLRTISLLRAIDRNQAMAIGSFHSVSRVNATLLRLVKAKFLNRFFLGVGPGTQKAIYTVAPKGANVAEIPYRRFRRRNDALYSGDLFLEHQLLISDIYVAANLQRGTVAQNWRTFERPLPETPIIPDAYFELIGSDSIKPVFLEVDRGTEPKKIWEKKVAGYLSFARSGQFERQTIAAQTSKIFWLTTFNDIKRDGLFGPIWLRPIEPERHSLL